MVERKSIRRNLLVIVAVVAFFVSAAGVVALAQGDEGEVFTGCVNENSGVLKSVAIGSEPAKPCNDKEVQITWDRAGLALEGRIADLEERVAELEAPFGTLDLFVDCDAGDTIVAALANAQTHLGPVSITISGVCEEKLDVTRDDVSFFGGQRSDGIRAASTDPWAVSMRDVQRVSFVNMTVSGGGVGIVAEQDSTFVASDITVRESQNGILAQGGSSASVNDCAIIDNSMFGVTAFSGSIVYLENCEITGNGQFGVTSGGTVQVSNSRIAHNLGGLAAQAFGSIVIQGSTIEHNAQVGVLAGGLGVAIGGGPTRIVDNGVGIRVGGGSSASIRHAIIEGNSVGISVGEGSHAAVQGTIVTDNAEDGIRVLDLSTIFVGPPETQITDNGGWGIFCGGPSAVAVLGGQVKFNPSDIVFSGNTAGDTNCQ